MLRDLVQSWSRDPWFLSERTNNTEEDPLNIYDQNSLFTSLLQLQDFYGQDELMNFEADNSPYYDEFTYVSDNITYVTETIEPSSLLNDNNSCSQDNTTSFAADDPAALVERKLSDCSSLSSFDSTKDFDSIEEISTSSPVQQYEQDEEEGEEEAIIAQPLNRRLLEETIMDKITHKLDPQKLPGILNIINADAADDVEEVEVDLERLEYDQLKRILAYTDACLLEKKGGPLVDVSNYMIQREATIIPLPTKQPCKQANKKSEKRQKGFRRQQPLGDGGHIVDGSSYAQLSSTHGPLSMSALTDLEEAEGMIRKNNDRKRRKTKKTKSKNEKNRYKPPMKNIKKPGKKRSAIHKRKLLEDMLDSSSNETDEEDEGRTEGGSGIIIFGDEKMDFAVTQNQTIVHNERRVSLSQQELQIATVIGHTEQIDDATSTDISNDIDDGEIIDIMS